MKTIDRSRLKVFLKREEKRYVADHPKSRALHERTEHFFLTGVPVNRMNHFESPFPLFIKEGKGAYITDVDEHRYLDLCAAGTGVTMFGQSQSAVVDAIIDQARRGIAFFAPTEDSVWVGEELVRRFGLPYWEIYMSASDANRFAIRVAREVTKRNLVLAFSGCFHGSVDETLVYLDEDGIMRNGALGDLFLARGLPSNPESRTRMIEFNDIDALEKALSPQDIACVITEPAITDLWLCHPDPGYHKALREMTRRFGTMLILDETHTISAGPGGCTRAWNLEPDIFTCGKPIAGGFPTAVMGVTKEVAERFMAPYGAAGKVDEGIGTTVSANPLAIAALKANLEHVMTESAYERMLTLAERLTTGIDRVIKAANLPWYVDRLGNRIEYTYGSTPAKNLATVRARRDDELSTFIHLFLVNRGILHLGKQPQILVSAGATAEDVDFVIRVFGECVNDLIE